MRYSFLAAGLGLAAFGVSAPQITPAQAQKPAGGRDTYAAAKLSVAPIPGYKKAPATQDKRATFVYVGPKVGKFVSNVNLVTQPAPPGLTADVKAAESLGEGIKRAFPQYKKLGTGTLTVGGEKAAFISGAFSGKGVSVSNKQVIVVHGGQGYIFTFTADAAAYPKQVAAFDKMVQSVKWQ